MIPFDLFKKWFLDQALGNNFPKNQILPGVSKERKWVTVVPAIFLNTLLGLFLGIYLTPFQPNLLVLLTILISILGLCGKLVSSKVRIELGILETSSVLPEGSILGYFNSLLFVAPIFYHLIKYWQQD